MGRVLHAVEQEQDADATEMVPETKLVMDRVESSQCRLVLVNSASGDRCSSVVEEAVNGNPSHENDVNMA